MLVFTYIYILQGSVECIYRVVGCNNHIIANCVQSAGERILKISQ